MTKYFFILQLIHICRGFLNNVSVGKDTKFVQETTNALLKVGGNISFPISFV